MRLREIGGGGRDSSIMRFSLLQLLQGRVFVYGKGGVWGDGPVSARIRTSLVNYVNIKLLLPVSAVCSF